MQGEVSEWSNEADSKSVIQLVVSGVQIPSSPPSASNPNPLGLIAPFYFFIN